MGIEAVAKVVLDAYHADGWAKRAQEALASLYGADGGRYPRAAEKAIAIRAPDMHGEGVPFAALIHPDNPTSGPYGGMSLVLFPAAEGPAMVALVVGTQGLNPDEEVLGRPGHARKAQAICRWLNSRAGGALVAWAKSDPTRIDEDVPSLLRT